MAGGVVAALVIGLAVGAVTEWFPTDVIPAATSGTPWVLVSFLVALTATGIASATARGLACMSGLAIGYYSVGTFHAIPPSTGTASYWIPAAMLIGPLAGLVAGCVRFGPPLLAQIAAGGFPGVLLGESIAAQDRLAIYRLMLALAGMGMMTALLAWQVRRYASQASTARAAAMTGPVALAACLAAGALTVSLYRYSYPYSYFL